MNGLMKKTLLIISSDPRTSPRPAEAFRVAAGLGAWGQLDVSIILVGAARRCRREATELWCDGRVIEQYREDLKIVGEEESASAEWVRELRARYDHVIRF
jgi:hypothetical protein